MNTTTWPAQLRGFFPLHRVARSLLLGLVVLGLLSSSPLARAGAGWGDTTNPLPSLGLSAFDYAGALKVRTYYANSPMGVQMDVLTGGLRDTGAPLRKFVDGLPGLGATQGSVGLIGNRTDGAYIPVATADTSTYADADYYEIAVVEYTQRMHSDLPQATHLRGYVQIDPKATDDAAALSGVTGLRGGAVSPPGSKALALSNPDGSTITISRPKADGTFVQVQAYAVDKPAYLGPTIVAAHSHATRLTFYNALPAGRSYTDVSGVVHRQGDLFIPVDHTLFGGGEGPTQQGYRDVLCGDAVSGPNSDPTPLLSSCLGGKNTDGTRTPPGYLHIPLFQIYTENRAELHLHGGDNPWISDGTPHQWIAPASDELNVATTANYQRGDGAINVPDMPNPGPGAVTYMWPNGQSGRLLFFHDHATGLTRLNVYAGEAAGYLVVDPSERTLGAFAPGGEVPLVIQDRTFVPLDIATEDARWDASHWGQPGDLWFAHVYETNQDPASLDGANAVGRWDGASYFWPVFPQNYATPSGVYGDVSTTPEVFNDTPIVNGMAYPTVTVDPTVYRFRLLNAANDRFQSLSFYVADDQVIGNSGIANTEVRMVPFTSPNGPTAITYLCPDGVSAGQTVGAVNQHGTVSKVGWTETGLNNTGRTLYLNSFPCAGGVMGTGWGQADDRPGGVPDPSLMGPAIIQFGNETGLLPQPVVIPPTPVNYEYNKRAVTVLNVLERGLWLANGERADVLVDFSQYAGKTLILYNDSGAPVPAGDPRIDYYTDDGDQTGAGGAPTTLAGYGPNTRTIMQVKVNGSSNGTAFDPAATLVNGAAFAPSLMAAYNATRPVPIVATTEYQAVAAARTAAGLPSFAATAPYEHIFTGAIYLNKYNAMKLTATDTFKYTPAPVCTTSATCLVLLTQQRQGTSGGLVTSTPGQAISAYVESKAIQELFDADYGRMNATLGVELPFTSVNNQTTVPLAYVDPVTETIAPGETQFWKITHNGVDSHPVHFHLLNVQVINRVGWDGTIKPPPPDEIGWKETLRMHPLEDIIVAVRLKAIPPVPFGLPHSYRQPAPNQSVADNHGITQVDATTGLAPLTPYTNALVDYGYEYVWHCHILGHEENDFMRPFVLRVHETLPGAPTGVSATLVADGIQMAWSDPSPIPTAMTAYNAITDSGFLGNPGNEIGFRVERALVTGNSFGPYVATNARHSLHTINAITGALNSAANGTSYLDSTVTGTAVHALQTPAAATVVASGTSAMLTLPTMPSGAGSFSIYRADTTTNQSAVGSLLASNILSTTWTDTTVVAGHVYGYQLIAVAPGGGQAPVYSYRVVAVNAAGESRSAAVQLTGVNAANSALSTSVAFLAVPSALAAPTLSAITTSSITVSWPAAIAVQTVSSYTVQQATNSGFTSSLVTNTVASNNTSLVVSGLNANVTYYFRVLAANASGAGAYGAAANAPTLAVAPGRPTVTAKTATSVSLSWTQASPTTGLSYAVRSAAGGALPAGASAAIAGTTAVVSGLASNTSYVFSLVATNASGASAPSADAAAALTLPAVLTGLQVGAITATSVVFTWATPASPTALTYAVTGGGSAVIAGTTATITGLTPNTSYTFSVMATNVSGSGAATAASAVRTLANAPAGIAVSAVTATGLTLSWTAPTPSTGVTYAVRGSAGGALATGAVATITGTSAAITGLTSNTSYVFSIVAINGTGNSAPSADSAATLTLPAAVTAVSAGAVTATTVVLNWTAPSNAAGLTYTVTGGGTAVFTGASATVSGLTANTAYTFSVAATNVSGSGVATAASAVRTLANAPAGIAVSAVTATGLTLSWTAPTPSTGVTYAVRGSAGGALATGAVATITGTSAAITGLTSNTSYVFSILAINGTGNSAPSADSAAILTLPAAVSGVLVSTVTTTSAVVTWAAPVSATGLTYAVTGGGSVGISGTTATITGLTPNTSYTFSVAATNVSGSGAATAATAVRTLPAAPVVTATGLITSATLSWTLAGSNSGVVYTVSGLPAGPAVAISGTTAAISGLLRATTYTLSVVATANGQSGAAGTVTFSTQAGYVTPSVPTGLALSSITTNSITVSWTAPTTGPAVSYTVQRATNAGFTTGLVSTAGVAGTSLTAPGLTANTTYYLRVMAVNSAGTSGYTAPLSATTSGPPATPAAPTAKAAPASTAAPSISLTFNAPAAGVTYKILQAYRTAAAGTWVTAVAVATGVTGTNWLTPAGSLTTGYQYRYYLVAVNATGNSANSALSATVTAAQLANAPLGVSATPVAAAVAGTGTRSVTLSWALGAANGAPITSVQLQRVTGAVWTGTVTSTTLAASATSTTVTGLVLNTIYTFRVNVVNAYGTTSSTTVTVTTAR